jgi:hypothetical protein
MEYAYIYTHGALLGRTHELAVHSCTLQLVHCRQSPLPSIAMARQPLLLFLFCFLATAAATTKRGQLRYITGMPETACAATELTPSSTHRLKVPLNHRAHVHK